MLFLDGFKFWIFKQKTELEGAQCGNNTGLKESSFAEHGGIFTLLQDVNYLYY